MSERFIGSNDFEAGPGRRGEVDSWQYQGLSTGSDQVQDATDNNAGRMDEATQRLQQIDGLRDENWRSMDIDERTATLRAAGRELEQVYQQPAPPVTLEDMGDRRLLGAYGDGYRYNAHVGEVEGSDYGIRLNASGEPRDNQLLGDDPKAALHTYAHEFRHSYQSEQANRWEKPQFHNLVDSSADAQRWSQNLEDYSRPSDGFDAYHNQPVEMDARQFADELVKRVYGE